TLQGFPKDWSNSDYGFARVVRTIQGSGTIDVGDIGVLKKRVKNGDPVGETGIHFASQPNDTPAEQQAYKVSWIDPAGPAANSGLLVGDVVTSIDGVDVSGANHANGWMLLRSPPGAKLALGLARGATVTIMLAAP